MNRIIKFRAWDGENMHHTTDDYLKWFPMRSFNKDEKVNDFVWMQFTGLHDKNGKEIYEGDVVRRDFTKKLWEVRWNPHVACYWLVAQNGSIHGIEQIEHYGEVIGNIYENPNLLTNA